MPAPLPPPAAEAAGTELPGAAAGAASTRCRARYWINHLALGISVGVALGAMAAAINRDAVEQPVRWLISLGQK